MNKIPTRQSGRSEVAVTELGFGGAPLGAVGAWQQENDADAMIQAAWDGGIRYFDTAPLDGRGLSEKHIGRGLHHHNRDEFVLSTVHRQHLWNKYSTSLKKRFCSS